MSTVDVLARLIGDTLRSDESAGCGGGFVDDRHLGSAVLDGRFDLRALAETLIATGWENPSATKTVAPDTNTRCEIKALRFALGRIEAIAGRDTPIERIARDTLNM